MTNDFKNLESSQDVIASFFDKVAGELASLSVDMPEPGSTRELVKERKEFRIRLANTQDRRESASILINKMYSWRGYENGSTLDADPNRITLLASGNDNEAIGTLSVGLDSPMGLFADEMYHEELDTLRSQGRRLCEYNRLAIDPKIKSKRIIASLFHIAYLYPYGIFGHTDGVIEVNPRHVKFYERMLGFTQIGPERTCPRVNAPAVLLRTDFSFVAHKVAEVGGLMEQADGEKSLYPYFFTQTDEAGILGRLKIMA